MDSRPDAIRGTYEVEGHSMDPTLADGQFLVVNKVSYSRTELRRGQRS